MKGRTEMTFLRDNLEEQIGCYRQLNELEKDKQDALINNDSRSIDRILSQEEIIIRRRNQLEADRVQWAASFTPWEAGQVSGHPEIVDLKNCLGQELEELQNLNQINSQLISSQLAYINYSVQSVAGDTKPMYGSPGTLNKPQRDAGVSRGFVDWNA
ncbi:MAG: flagellar protein FlgN [Peptococcaceae bacterium]|nr:flagellar protein FlgN [Peptococcaceae bacterium]